MRDRGQRGQTGGGGVSPSGSPAGVTITNCVITGNETTAVAGCRFRMTRAATCSGTARRANSADDVWRRRLHELERPARPMHRVGQLRASGSELSASSGTRSLVCSDVDSAGVATLVRLDRYDEHCVFTDPMFCAPVPCGQTTAGDWTLNESSPCLPSNSPCGQLIGALDAGCGVAFPPGACCLVGGACVVVSEYVCSLQQARTRATARCASRIPAGRRRRRGQAGGGSRRRIDRGRRSRSEAALAAGPPPRHAMDSGADGESLSDRPNDDIPVNPTLSRELPDGTVTRSHPTTSRFDAPSGQHPPHSPPGNSSRHA